LDEAEELGIQVMETRKRILGAEHPDTLQDMKNLASTWKKCGQETRAIRLLEECVLLRKRILGDGHPKSVSSSQKLARWKAKKVDIDNAT
jgi:hypothetical protein